MLGNPEEGQSNQLNEGIILRAGRKVQYWVRLRDTNFPRKKQSLIAYSLLNSDRFHPGSSLNRSQYCVDLIFENMYINP